MNVEFHYYVIYHLARKAGFADQEAWTVAYSSQHVDASTVSWTVRVEGREERTLVTQDYGWWDESFPLTVYIPFHFLPGDPAFSDAQRADGASNPLSTTPGSPNAKALLVDALKTRDLYRVGIALHTYADSWAHQNWSGVREDWNAVEAGSMIPAIGHAQVLTNPDRMNLIWEDPRLSPESRSIRNWERHFAAARMVYKYLATYTGQGFEDADFVMDELDEILKPRDQRRTGEERILDLIISQDLRRYGRREWLEEAVFVEPGFSGDAEQSGYDKLLWLKDAALHRTSLLRRKPVTAREGYSESHLRRWNEAAKAHREAAWRVLPARLRAMAGSSRAPN